MDSICHGGGIVYVPHVGTPNKKEISLQENMFCQQCGKEMGETARFCQHCGKGTKNDDKEDEIESKSATKCVKVKSFRKFYQEKVKKEKTKSKQSDKNCEVVINIGILKWSPKELKLKPVRGKRVPIRVRINDPFSTILLKAIEKFKAFHDECLFYEDEYTLCFENGGECILLPGTEEPFNLKKYQLEIGKDFKRIVLYLCSIQEQMDSQWDDKPTADVKSNEPDDDEPEDDETEDCEKSNEPVSKKPHIDNQDKQKPCRSRSENTQSPESTTKLACPVCFQLFPSSLLESHVPDCAQVKYDFEEYGTEDEINSTSATIPYRGVDDEGDVSSEQTKEPNELLENLMEFQKKSITEVFKVRRSSAWKDFIAHQEKKWSKPGSNINVTFLKESAIDTGGPRREFFSVALKQMASCILENGNIVSSLMLLNEKKYLYAGNLIGMSLIQGGPIPNVFSKQTFDMISCKKSLVPGFFEVPQEFIESNVLIKQIWNAKSHEEFRTLMLQDNIFQLLSNVGCIGIPKISDKDNIVKLAFFKSNIEPLLPAVQQLSEGLNIHGLLDMVKQNPEGFKDCFVKKEEVIQLQMFFEEIEPVFSEQGSNKFLKEEILFKNFCDYLERCFYDRDSTTKLTDVLQFITGCSNVPFAGFDKKISVEFNHFCQADCRCLPTASTCALSIRIPHHMENYETMLESMDRSIIESPFFGRV